MTANLLNCCLPRRKGKLKITRNKEPKLSCTKEINSNILPRKNSYKIEVQAKQAVAMEDNSLHRVVLLVNFKPLERTEQDTFELTESQRVKRDRTTRSWTWANLDWEGSLTADESSSTSSAESSESEEYYEYIPPIEHDEDPSDDEKTEMIMKWLWNSNIDLKEHSQFLTSKTD